MGGILFKSETEYNAEEEAKTQTFTAQDILARGATVHRRGGVGGRNPLEISFKHPNYPGLFTAKQLQALLDGVHTIETVHNDRNLWV